MNRSFLELRGRIASRYGTLAEFEKAMEMSHCALNQRMQGRTFWKPDEIEKAQKLLDVPDSEVYIFLRP